MRRLAYAILPLFVITLSSHDARSGASSSSVITSPDCLTTATGAGCLYVQAASLGVRVENPTGQTLGFTSTDIAGGGSVHISNNGIEAFYGGAANVINVRAIQYANNGVTFLSTGTTQLPAPDLSFASPTGQLSYYRLVPLCGTGCNWTGGIAAPTAAPGGSNAFGTIATLINVSGGGAAINVIDITQGGTLRVGSPSVVLGYLETMQFIYDSQGWELLSRGPAYSFNGGDVNGGRVITTTTATATPIMSWNKGNSITNGLTIQCDVAAKDTASSDTGFWYGVKCAWDASNTQTLAITIANSNGNNGGAVPAGWTLTCSDDASNHNLNVATGTTANVEWRANNCTQTAPPF